MEIGLVIDLVAFKNYVSLAPRTVSNDAQPKLFSNRRCMKESRPSFLVSIIKASKTRR